MRLFKRTKAHHVFVPEIDLEHRTICRTVDELHQAILAEAPQLQVLEILHRLIGLAETHFAHEESLMRRCRYMSFDWHRRQHETVRKRLRLFVPKMKTGDREAARMLIQFLAGWMSDHTAVADRMLGAHIRNQMRFKAA